MSEYETLVLPDAPMGMTEIETKSETREGEARRSGEGQGRRLLYAVRCRSETPLKAAKRFKLLSVRAC